MSKRLLEIIHLKTHFITDEGVVKAVDGISLHLDEGDTLGIVGESGCGKSVSALSIMRLIPDPPGKIVGGEIFFEGQNLLKLKESDMRKIRGNKISMIFQEPMTSLNPVFKIGDQISEVVRLHRGLSKKDALDVSVSMLRLVGFPSPERRIEEYPHQMSGGMRQRVMIAMALSCNPQLVIADEPTTALDVTIQAQIMDLMNRLKEEIGMSIILITHDLGVIAETAQHVAVMYAGKIVEYTSVTDLFKRPMHPYTEGLLHSLPGMKRNGEAKIRLDVIPGVLPGPSDLPDGCRFGPRCKYVMTVCQEHEPTLKENTDGHLVSCWKYTSE
ncbi:MAG: ABC transporter ATP-binding protein [Thermodesulfobacteriota bacterium]|nr:ABC transporter ATP-binding protein [Thermodesulfobacteriota bacterium]